MSMKKSFLFVVLFFCLASTLHQTSVCGSSDSSASSSDEKVREPKIYSEKDMIMCCVIASAATGLIMLELMTIFLGDSCDSSKLIAHVSENKKYILYGGNQYFLTTHCFGTPEFKEQVFPKENKPCKNQKTCHKRDKQWKNATCFIKNRSGKNQKNFKYNRGNQRH